MVLARCPARAATEPSYVRKENPKRGKYATVARGAMVLAGSFAAARARAAQSLTRRRPLVLGSDKHGARVGFDT